MLSASEKPLRSLAKDMTNCNAVVVTIQGPPLFGRLSCKGDAMPRLCIDGHYIGTRAEEHCPPHTCALCFLHFGAKLISNASASLVRFLSASNPLFLCTRRLPCCFDLECLRRYCSTALCSLGVRWPVFVQARSAPVPLVQARKRAWHPTDALRLNMPLNVRFSERLE